MRTIANSIYPSVLMIMLIKRPPWLGSKGVLKTFVTHRMLNDKLKLNDEKTEFMIIGTSQQLAKVSINSLRVGTATITPVSSARNLGSWFDSKLMMAIQSS